MWLLRTLRTAQTRSPSAPRIVTLVAATAATATAGATTMSTAAAAAGAAPVSSSSSPSSVAPSSSPSDAFGPEARTMPLYADGRYSNPWPGFVSNSGLDALRMMWQSMGASPLQGVDLERELPVLKPSFGTDSSRVYYTWLGHATAVLQLRGLNVLIDPIFSQRCGPTQWTGIKRYRPVACSVAELPPIDVVLISHNHYDHLDLSSCRLLAAQAEKQRQQGRVMRWYVGKGIEDWLVAHAGVRKEDATGLSWWEQSTHSAVATASSAVITAVPCQHFSVRSPLPSDERKTLWVGFTLRHGDYTVFYSGDTAYCPAFKQIAHCTPRIDLAVLPIAAYEPNWFMRRIHVGPEEAVDIMQDVRAAKAVAVHWGTFLMTTEPVMEPPQRLRAEMQKRGLDADSFVVSKHGETLTLA